MRKELQKGILCIIAIFFFTSCKTAVRPVNVGVVPSFDDVPISYTVYGAGDIALVFVHGWSCDSRYWHMQVPYFARKYRVVTIDLAGHGHSGLGRETYSMKAFGEDVKSVVEAIEAERIILIGHSMGGGVIAEAVRLMPKRVIGIIGVDTLHDIEHKADKDEIQRMVDDYADDFSKHVKIFVNDMFASGTDPTLMKWIVNDMAAAPPQVGISAFEEYMGQYITGEAAEVFDENKVPVRCVNADLWPTNPEANRRHMVSFEVVIMKGVGHFLMLESPHEFNRNLADMIEDL